jgi:K+-sensing histidine kinase KdpD
VPEIATMASSEARRLSGIVDNMVVVARSEIGGLGEALSEPVDIARLVLTSWRRVSSDDDGLVVRGDAVASCDERRLEHVLSNLFDNVKRHGSLPVTVDVAAHGERVWAAVRDAGPGLRHDALNDSAPDQQNTRPDNLGLGLEVARMLMSTMDGELAAEEGAAVLSLNGAV